MKPQCGATTIIITSVLVSIILTLVMASAKGVWYQLKHSNNQVDGRRSYWQAEGGLECAFTKMLGSGELTQNFSDCIAMLGLDELKIEQGTPNIIRSSSGYVTLSKAFYLPELKITSPITTRSNLLVNGNLSIDPNIGPRINNTDWQCYSLRYIGELYAQSFSSKYSYQADLETRYFPSVNSFPTVDSIPRRQCADSYFTSLAWRLEDTLNDFSFEPDIDPFKEVFNLERHEWFSVMSDTSRLAHVPIWLTESMPTDATQLPKAVFINNCGQEVVSLVKAAHQLIWVYGGCELSDEDIYAINLAIETHLESGLVLVFHNGIVSISAQQPLKGLVYHLVTSDLPLGDNDWSKTANDKPPSALGQTIEELSFVTRLRKQQVSYFQNGRFYPLGGLVLDAPERYALINGSLSTEYSKYVTESVARDYHSLTWVLGSWYDF
ncbi:hypothetical protein [Vibrio hepatarius]|uniref:hypothetical protein n=1 Tax=Vibrio hepatarius TaxID=171383 RepID=UPI001C098166|nr:hypothetical protein [Vibrio hepatarius]MBU2898409.1 hypothetical protein [Vibrio hepatarius]